MPYLVVIKQNLLKKYDYQRVENIPAIPAERIRVTESTVVVVGALSALVHLPLSSEQP